VAERDPDEKDQSAMALGLGLTLARPVEIRAGRPQGAGTDAQGAARAAVLVRAARAGDREAFGEVYRLYSRLVHGVLLSLLPPAEVPDLVQEVFLHALRHLHSLRDEGAFGGWISALARNAARDHHRRPVQRAPRVELDENLPAPGAEVGDQAEALAILAALRTLPQAYRETLTLRLVEGMTGPEIAARTGLTPDSVRVNLHRGMAKLRACLQGGGR
jgi:RNA polymerase sigma-70 factor (ECF subfamily)